MLSERLSYWKHTNILDSCRMTSEQFERGWNETYPAKAAAQRAA